MDSPLTHEFPWPTSSSHPPTGRPHLQARRLRGRPAKGDPCGRGPRRRSQPGGRRDITEFHFTDGDVYASRPAG